MPRPRGPRRLRIEVLTFDGCPNAERAHALVERVVADVDVDAEVRSVRVETLDAAGHHRFLGSPTFRVDGRDVEPGADARGDYTLACRAYATNAGPSNLPDERWLRRALSGSSDSRH